MANKALFSPLHTQNYHPIDFHCQLKVETVDLSPIFKGAEGVCNIHRPTRILEYYVKWYEILYLAINSAGAPSDTNSGCEAHKGSCWAADTLDQFNSICLGSRYASNTDSFLCKLLHYRHPTSCPAPVGRARYPEMTKTIIINLSFFVGNKRSCPSFEVAIWLKSDSVVAFQPFSYGFLLTFQR